MSKSIERNILDQVYGKTHGWAVIPHESPDFLCQRDKAVVLGVEVTEFFNSESDARLHKVPGYARTLLTSREYLHKDDKASLRIETITYMPDGDPVKAIEIDAIIRQVPQLNERLEKLRSILTSKSFKNETYSSNAPMIDLIIHDPNHAFRFEQFCEIYRYLSSSDLRSLIIASPFREIFLVTLGADDKRVCVPLKANTFAEEIVICEHLFLAKANVERGGCGLKEFCNSLVGVLWNAGFRNSHVCLKDGEIHLRFSSIEFVYSGNGKRINDFTITPEDESKDMTVDLLAKDLMEDDQGRIAEICESRKEYTASMDLYFPAHADL
jgi:hypothetical protein